MYTRRQQNYTHNSLAYNTIFVICLWIYAGEFHWEGANNNNHDWHVIFDIEFMPFWALCAFPWPKRSCWSYPKLGSVPGCRRGTITSNMMCFKGYILTGSQQPVNRRLVLCVQSCRNRRTAKTTRSCVAADRPWSSLNKSAVAYF